MNDVDTTTTIDAAQFLERLEKIGITTVDGDTLRTWSNEGLIPPYENVYQRRIMKRGRPTQAEKGGRVIQKARLGRPSKWPEKALWEAAAVWAVHEIVEPKAFTESTIDTIRGDAISVFTSPQANYVLRPEVCLGGPDPAATYDPGAFQVKFVNNDRADELAKTWIAALVKAREGVPLSEHKKVIFHWHSLLPELQEDLSVRDLLLLRLHHKIQTRRSKWGNVPEWLFPEWLLKRERSNPPADSPIAISPSTPFRSMQLYTDYPPYRAGEYAVFDEITARRLDEAGIAADDTSDEYSILSRQPRRRQIIDDVPEKRELVDTRNGLLFALDKVALEKLTSERDEFVIFFDNNDVREKVMYAPFSLYYPFKKYDSVDFFPLSSS